MFCREYEGEYQIFLGNNFSQLAVIESFGYSDYTGPSGCLGYLKPHFKEWLEENVQEWRWDSKNNALYIKDHEEAMLCVMTWK